MTDDPPEPGTSGNARTSTSTWSSGAFGRFRFRAKMKFYHGARYFYTGHRFMSVSTVLIRVRCTVSYIACKAVAAHLCSSFHSILFSN